MQWWNSFLDWFNSNDGQDVLTNGVVPFVAIVVAGFVAALIGRGSIRRLLTLNDRENRVAAVATLIGAARRASVWNTLSAPEQQHADHVASEADVRVRLLAVTGSGLAADWATHEIATMKKNSVSFSFQAEQSLIEFRDRIVTWQARPSRAKKLFKNDLELWAYEDSQTKNDIVSQQQAWAAAQVATTQTPTATPVPAPLPSNDTPTVAVTTPAGLRPAAATAPVAAPSTPLAPQPAPPAGSATSGADAPTTTSTTHAAPAVTSAYERPAQAPAAHTPELVAPEPASDSDRRLEEALHPAPVSAGSVTKRTNPDEDDDAR